MKNFTSTLNQKDKHLTLEQRKKLEEAKKNHEKDMSEIKGDTPKVQRLKRQLEIYVTRSNTTRDNNGNTQTLDPKRAHELTLLAEVRNGLMKDSSNFFGTLDHGIIRKTHEWLSLNIRQQKTISKNFPWIIQELEDDPEFTAKLEAVKWNNPLQTTYDQLNEAEQAHFDAKDRMSIHYGLEQSSISDKAQPYAYTVDNTTGQENVVFGAPLSSVK